jgi:PAS domain-containing protein
VSFVRSRTIDHFGKDEIAFMRMLSPHVVHAVHTSVRVGALEGRLHLAKALLDAAAEPVALVDADGRLIHANRGALAIFNRGDGFLLAKGVVGCAGHDAAAALRAAIHAAARGTPRRAQTLVVGRVSRARPYGVLVAPVAADIARGWPAERYVAVLIADPEARPADGTAVLDLQMGRPSCGWPMA